MKIQLAPSMKTTVFLIFVMLNCPIFKAGAATIAKEPLFLTSSVPPIVMLTMERDHKLYYEAYNDASDINGDGVLDVRYNPAIDYFGYFDSHKCYSYASGKFTPATVTLNKKCSSAWSGDFLNYLTTSRMDALRRVLYGGKRSTDTTTSTILERSYIPQDAHSWGKEYTSELIDGYKITDYTPLLQPTNGTRHLFANTTLLCPSGNSDPGCNSNSGLPLLRVLNDTAFRVWEWLSIERPVAGVQCATGNNVRSNCAVAAAIANWVIVPSSYFSNLTQTTYNTTGYNTWPNDHTQFDTLVSTYGITAKKFGTTTANQINGSGNPNSGASGSQDNYLTIFDGNLVIPNGEDGTYSFAVDGDDAVEVIIDGSVLVGWYGGHGNNNSSSSLTSHSASKFLSEGSHTIRFRHQEYTGGDNYYLYWQKTLPSSVITDYVVRVDACVSGLLESQCRGYPTTAPTSYKPAGLLQEYGEGDKMAFGLITGSYAKNVSGGVLRKNISSLTDEIDAATGVFTSTNGVIKTINALKIVDFAGDYYYNNNCGVPEVGGPLAEGRCRMWGNPTGEMMYEGLRYFAGKATPTTEFSIASTGTDDSNLGLPLPTWLDPYRSTASGGYLSCAKPSQLVISDINPNYDTDLLPGRHTYTVPSTTPTFTGDITNLNVESLADTIWATEYGSSQSLFIGQSGGTYDGAPTAKTVTSFGNIRGLAPEGPTQQGGYYPGSIGLFGRLNDVNPATGKQQPDTLSVALASPLPRIRFPLANSIITLVPFAKTVGGCGSISTSVGSYQPTNTIVDFYVDTIKNTDVSNVDSTVNGGRAYAKFRINYEDSEYGSDHDMDAIAEYELTANSNNTVDVKVASNYAAGGCIQHMGYVISGTSADGTYLEVRDPDTASGSDIDYYLDTPHNRGSGVALPTTHTRNYSLGTNTSASFVAHDPLWYAAKWGVADKNGDGILDTNEWDAENNTTPNGLPDGVPDGYFLVTNASQLSVQLGKAFARLINIVSSASAVAANTTKLNTGTLVYQARFDPRDWSGQLLALAVDSITGIPDTTTPNWEAATVLPAASDRNIYTYNPAATAGSRGIPFLWANLTTTPSGTSQQDYLNQLSGVPDTKGSDRLNWLRGDNSKEYRLGGTFRNRIKRFVNDSFLTSATDLADGSIKTNKLGDIVNSDPIYVGTDDFGFSSLPGAEGTDYTAFRASSSYVNRRPMVYMGANDGMLHGFDARKNTGTFTEGGKEIFAYVPNALFPELSKLTLPTYQHQYYVDGISNVSDVYYDSAWHTLLAGATGAGGRALFALNVTDPDTFGTSSALWEFTNVNDSDLGYTFGQPVLGKMNDGSWVVIAANGYNSDAGHAALFILNAKTGALIKKIDTGVGTSTNKNGLSSPVAVDTNNDKKIDVIYAGDLYGNLWKFDVSATSPTSWAVANSGSPLFVACAAAGATCSSSDLQPITGKPSVGAISTDQSAGIMVYFGTGKYFETSDGIVPTNPQVETFYGLWDNNTGKITDRANLQTQTIDFEGVAVNNSGSTSSTVVRATSRNTVCYSTSTTPANDDDTLTTTCSSSNLKRGWLIDLIVKPANTPKGERVVTPPVMYQDMVIFSTIIPSADPCASGGQSRLMLLEAVTGKRSSSANFDLFGGTASSPSLSKDNKVDNADLIKVNGKLIAASGIDLGIGIHKNLSIVASHGYASGSSGDLGNITLKSSATTTTGSSTSGKRVSWRQLR